MAKQKTASRRTARPKDNGSDKAKSGSGDSGSTYEKELTELLQERIKPNLNRGSIPLLARSLAKDIASRQRSEEDDDARDEADEESETDGESKAETDEAPENETEDAPKAEADEDEDEDEAGDEPEAEADEDLDDVDEEPEDEDEEPADDEDEEPADDEDEEPADDEDDADEEEPEGEGGGEDPVSAFEEEMHQLQEDLGDEWIVRFSVQNDEAWLTAEKEDGSQHVEGPTADVLREAVELLEGGDESD